jgi:hypothetical protein
LVRLDRHHVTLLNLAGFADEILKSGLCFMASSSNSMTHPLTLASQNFGWVDREIGQSFSDYSYSVLLNRQVLMCVQVLLHQAVVKQL